MQFQELHLNDALLRAVAEQGYTEPTPIQAMAIPHLLDGRDLIGLAQTGTGKTAAFALPTLHTLALSKGKKQVRVLVLAPTRELAAQIGESFEAYGKYTTHRQTTIFGGVSQKHQEKALRRGVDIVTATPGRLLDLMQQKVIRFDQLETLILDEADRMLDMGFLPDIKRIIKALPSERQTLLFSATMPPDIQQMSQQWLTDPVEVEVAPESTTVEAIEQRLYHVAKNDKTNLLKHLITQNNMFRVLVFTRTKHGANRLAEKLNKAKITAEAIHGNKSQNARQRALRAFVDSKVHVLVATDIVARGIDVDDITHVVNFDLPNETESYVHRIGRTGRAGKGGTAIAFCSPDERNYLHDIERLIQMHIPVGLGHPYELAGDIPVTDMDRKRRGNSGKAANGKPKSRNQRRKRSRNRNRKNNQKRSPQPQG